MSSYSAVGLDLGTYAYNNRKMLLEKYGRICVLHAADVIVPHGVNTTVTSVPDGYAPTYTAYLDVTEPGGRSFRIAVSADKSVKIYNYGTTDAVMNVVSTLMWVAAN